MKRIKYPPIKPAEDPRRAAARAFGQRVQRRLSAMKYALDDLSRLCPYDREYLRKLLNGEFPLSERAKTLIELRLEDLSVYKKIGATPPLRRPKIWAIRAGQDTAKVASNIADSAPARSEKANGTTGKLMG